MRRWCQSVFVAKRCAPPCRHARGAEPDMGQPATVPAPRADAVGQRGNKAPRQRERTHSPAAQSQGRARDAFRVKGFWVFARGGKFLWTKLLVHIIGLPSPNKGCGWVLIIEVLTSDHDHATGLWECAES